MTKKKIILAHDTDEEDIAEKLQKALGIVGYEVVHRGTVLVGEYYTQEFSKYLDQRFPVVICGTVNAIGTGWARRIVNAAQASEICIFPVKLESKADLNSIIPSDLKVIDCSGTNFDKGIERLIIALQKYYPVEDDNHLRQNQEEVIQSSSYLDKPTPETHFNEQAVSAYREKLRDEIRESYPAYLPHKVFLDKIGLSIDGRLTLTGVLLFTEHATRYSPMAITKCSSYGGTEPLRRHEGKKKDIDGPVQKQIDEAYNFILLNIDKKERRKPNRAELETVYRYPIDCIREIIANALCHRDYTIADRPVQVRLFTDRLEITSPGKWYGRELVDGHKYLLEELKTESRLRNPTLAKAIYNVRLFEGRGEGIPTSIDDCQQTGAPMPTVIERAGNVVVTVFPREDWIAESSETPVSTTPGRTPLDPERISIGRLPATERDLFGRDPELAMLDGAWADPGTNVVSLIAWGGVGKSALVNYWLRGMERDHYRGAERVYAWSFYRQGTSEQGVSADQFIDAALRWFGDPDPTAGSPWDKGERLARLVKEQRTLLLLDGLEPLQFPPGRGHQDGALKEHSMQALLRELAAHNPGLCVITSRLAVFDLQEYERHTARRIDLEHLSPQAGAEVLRAQGAVGEQAKLERASSEFGGHALALTLLGSYLKDVHDGDITQRVKVELLKQDEERGGHVKRVMASYEKWFGEGPELSVLRMIGLFDRPAEGPSLAALRTAPAILGLTDPLQGLSDEDWRRTLSRLRSAKLIAAKDPNQPDTLDAHPLVREYFGQRLKQQHPGAWREGHNRLYEHLKRTTKEFPDTIEEMTPLFAAVAHGCAASRYQEALDEVYKLRIIRGNRFFNIRKLGAFGADLAALTGFFDPPWRQPVSTLDESDKAFILNVAGFYLRALGRLVEATQLMQAGLEADILLQDWRNAAISTGNLSEIYLTIADLSQALSYAQKSIELADRSGDSFQLMINRTTLADALYHSGRLSESEVVMREAEEIQKNQQPAFPLLYSLQGFQYCALLLHQGKYQEVQTRAAQSLEWAKQSNAGLLTIALDYLSLGCAYLFQAQHETTGDFLLATDYLNRAVDGLRQAGHLEFLSRGLLARAELHRVKGEPDRARVDLDEAMSIASRGSMGLHQADCHLEYARLHLAQGEKDRAREHWLTAKGMIERMGYHLRDGEVEKIEQQLKEA